MHCSSYPALIVERDVKGGQLVQGVPSKKVKEEVIGEESAKIPLHVQYCKL